MKTIHAPRVMVAGLSSGSGKTTLMCALLAAMKMAANISAFKCGPDFIDPMFHTEVLGVPSRNLDMFLCSEKGMLDIFYRNAAEFSIIEGVMGFYDGIGTTSRASSYEISEQLSMPVILCIPCKGAALSVAATVSGFLNFRRNNIKGVVLNGIKTASYEFYKEIIEKNTGLKVYGHLPDIPEAAFQSRHLGLVTAAETADILYKIERLKNAALEHIDINAIFELAKTAPDISYEPIDIGKIANCKIGIAHDEAFCFYYKDNIEMLERMGAEIIKFSPLHDEALPKDIGAVIFGGGYPEVHIEKLSANQSFLDSVRRAATDGMPIYAECGGYMYLHDNIDGYTTAGVIKGTAEMTKSLQRFGYCTLEARHDNILCAKGDRINAHEFHYSKSSADAVSFTAKKASNGAEWGAVYTDVNIFGGYPHLHFYSNFAFAESFVNAAERYGRRLK